MSEPRWICEVVSPTEAAARSEALSTAGYFIHTIQYCPGDCPGDTGAPLSTARVFIAAYQKWPKKGRG